MTPTEMIEVIKAYEEGKEIEIWNGRTWANCTPPLWNFAIYNYRIKKREEIVYQFLLQNKNDASIMSTSHFYPDLKTAQKDYSSINNYTVIKRLDYTKTIIKE